MNHAFAILNNDVQSRKRQQSYEEQLLRELIEMKERNRLLEFDLSERRFDVAKLQASIDVERRITDDILDEQRWLVPHVAVAVQDLRNTPPRPSVPSCWQKDECSSRCS